MPNIDLYKKMLGIYGRTVGERHKTHSDIAMEATWNSDIQSKICYIYDYYHDDDPSMSKGMVYDSTIKTRIDAKFIVVRHSTIAADQVEYYVQFRPSQKVRFDASDDLYYYENNYVKRIGSEFPVGMYIDIPDDTGLYRKWMICDIDYGNQFIKYIVLPCNYYLMWIEQYKGRKYKRYMWCVARSQNSYNAGLWTNYHFTSVENQDKLWLPCNQITERLYYTHDNGDTKNQRLIVSSLSEHPIVWKISKVENYHPVGIIKITLSQDKFDHNTDYVNLETGEMFADYYSESHDENDYINTNNNYKFINELSCNTNNIKAGGSYKTIRSEIISSDGDVVTEKHLAVYSLDSWKFYINDELYDVNNPSNDLIQISTGSSDNEIRVKFKRDLSYLSKLLTIECSVVINGKSILGKIGLQIIAL